MTTLVYFASGPNKKEYQDLHFDKIYLIDNCFKKGKWNNVYSEGKVICIGMDCLESIAFLKKEKVKIDCFVSLNEGLYEGGGSYAINSDMFLGYAMPLFKKEYIHIMNKNYYNNRYNVSMDLPFKKEELFKEDIKFIDPTTFSSEQYHKKNTKVFQMRRIKNYLSVTLNSNIKLTVNHESIWNHFNKLDLVILSLFPQGQGDFFKKFNKVININNTDYNSILELCVKNKTPNIGFTPWLNGNYTELFGVLNNYKKEYPKEITLFHLNKSDYADLKKELNTFIYK